MKKKFFRIVFIFLFLITLAFLILVAYKKDSEIDSEWTEYAKSVNREVIKEHNQQIEAEKKKREEEEAIIQEEQAKIRQEALKAGLDETYAEKLVWSNTEEKIYAKGEKVTLTDIDIEGKVSLIKMRVKAIENNSIIIFANNMSETTVSYEVSNQDTILYLPLVELDSIDICFEGNIEVKNIDVYCMNCDYKDVINGLWLIESEYEKIAIDYRAGISSVGTYACYANDNYLYVADKNGLTVYDISSGTEKAISTCKEAQNIRHIAINEKGTILVASARFDGAYIIDISDVNNIKLVSQIESLELVSGIAIEGNYAYLCSRYFGIEIWDISIPDKPVFCSVLRGSREYQNCYIDNGILYIAVYNDARVVAYDVTNPYNPIYLSEYLTDGKAYGIYVADGILYTTIAVAPFGYSTSDYQYGLGNGFEIIDVSDPENMKKISTTTLDGRFDIGTLDIFQLLVQDNKLYMTHSYNGLYIYDISNLNAPKRMEQYWIPRYIYDKDVFTVVNNNKLWSINRELCNPDTLIGLTLGKDRIYIAANSSGLFKIEKQGISPLQDANNTDYQVEKLEYNTDIVEGDISVELFEEIDAKAIAVFEDEIFIASPNSGIIVCDDKMNRKSSINVPGNVRDVCVNKNGLIYVASQKGLYIYENDGNTYPLVAKNNLYPLSDIITSKDGINILAQGNSTYYLFSVTNDNRGCKIVEKESQIFRGIYYRNIISSLLENDLFAIQTNSGVKWWNADTLEEIDTTVVTYLSEMQGYAAYKDKCIAVYKGGYVVYDPLSTKEIDFQNLKIHYIPNEILNGKASVIDNRILVVSKEWNGEIWFIDIQDIDNPVLLGKYTSSGHPDIAVGTNKRILVPLRHEGVLAVNY